MQVAPNFSFY